MFNYRFNCGKPATKLAYTLKKAENSLIFQVNEQSADITNFLANSSYRAKNGMLIAGSHFPEFKDSEYTLYLRGDDKSHDYKLDVTRFVGNMQRDKRATQIEEALKEFVGFIKSSSSLSYAPFAYAAPPAFEVIPVILV